MKKILLLISITLFVGFNLSAETIAPEVTIADDNTTVSNVASDSVLSTNDTTNNKNAVNDNSSKVIDDSSSNDAIVKDNVTISDSKSDNVTEQSIEGSGDNATDIIASEDIEYNKYIALNASYYMPSGGKEIFNPNFSLGFLFGYLFLDYLGIEVGVTSQTKSRSTKYDIKALLIGQYPVFELNKLPVYIYGGAGVIYSSLDPAGSSSSKSGSESSFNFGAKAGLKITIGGRYNLGVVAEYLGAKFYGKDFSAVTVGAEVGIMF